MTVKRRPVDPRPGDYLAKLLHRRGAESGASWFVSASELERATEILWAQVEQDWAQIHDLPPEAAPPQFIICPTMLLAAATIENSLKGICVSREPALDKNGAFRLKTHKLLDLFDRIKFQLSADELDLVERLEVFLEWAGRYPVPLTHHSMLPRTHPSGGFGSLTYRLGSDREVWHRLVRRLDELLESLLSRAGAP